MLALAQDILAAGLALAAYAFGIRLFLGRCRRIAPPLIRPAHPLSHSSNDNEACHVRAASGR